MSFWHLVCSLSNTQLVKMQVDGNPYNKEEHVWPQCLLILVKGYWIILLLFYLPLGVYDSFEKYLKCWYIRVIYIKTQLGQNWRGVMLEVYMEHTLSLQHLSMSLSSRRTCGWDLFVLCKKTFIQCLVEELKFCTMYYRRDESKQIQF